ncbi:MULTISPECIES: hypothetical protein [Nocardia]|uniref:hypothetical protein n=1 Tax=Nocardia TaxID=1817 RepID=UPI001300BAFA|nr:MULTISPECIES: hypothetical protein [Nocardia]
MNRTMSFPAIALTVICLTGCAAQTTSTVSQQHCRETGFAAPFNAVDPCDGEAVLTAGLAAVFGYRPVEQADQRDTAAAARPLLTPRLAELAETSAATWGPVTATVWQRWREERTPVHTNVRVSQDDHPPDTATTLARVAVVELDATGAAPTVFPVYATVSRTGPATGWLLSGLRVLS